MLNLLLKNDRLLIFIAPLILIVGTVSKLIVGVEELHADSLFHLSFIQSWPVWLNYSVGALFALASGFIANQTIQSWGILGRISNIPLLLVVLLFFMLPDQSNFFYLWVLFLLQLLVLRWVELIPDETKKIPYYVFNAGLVIGLLMLFESWSLLLFFLVIQSLAAVGMLSAKRILIGFIGLLIPLYFYNGFLYIFHVQLALPSFEIAIESVLVSLDQQSAMGLLFVLFMTVLAGVSVMGVSGSSTLRARRRWMVVVSYMVISSFLVMNKGYTDMAIFILLPAIIVFSKLLVGIKNQRIGSLLLIAFCCILFFFNA